MTTWGRRQRSGSGGILRTEPETNHVGSGESTPVSISNFGLIEEPPNPDTPQSNCRKKQEAKEAEQSSTPPATVFGLQWCNRRIDQLWIIRIMFFLLCFVCEQWPVERYLPVTQPLVTLTTDMSHISKQWIKCSLFYHVPGRGWPCDQYVLGWSLIVYPLVNIQTTMENHHV